MAGILRQEHVSFDVIPTRKIMNMQGKLLIISDVAYICDDEMECIEQHLKNGGSIYISGHIGHERLYQLMEAEYEGETEHNVTYMCPTEAG